MAIALRGTVQTGINGGGNSVSVNVPAGVVNGDLLIAHINGYSAAAGGTPSSPTTPSGWTAIAAFASTNSGTNNNTALGVFYRYANNEPASYTLANSGGTTYIDAAIAAYSGVDPTTPFNLTSVSAAFNATSGNSADPGTPTRDGCWALLFASSFDSISTTPASFTTDANWDGVPASNFILHKLISPPADVGAQSFSGISASDGTVIWSVVIQPPAGVTFTPIYPRISGLATPFYSFTPVIGLQATFLQANNPPLIPSAGIAPQVLQVVQKRPKPTRSLSDVGLNLSVTNPQWIRSLPYNSGGITPQVTLGVQKPRPRRTISDSGINPAINRSGTSWIVPLTYNSGGITASSRIAIQKKRPTRGNSRVLPAPLFNSNGLVPTLVAAVQKKVPTRGKSDWNNGTNVTAASNPQIYQPPIYNSGGLTPQVLQAVQKKRPTRSSTRIIISQASAAVVSTAPQVLQATQKRRVKNKPSSILQLPTLATPGNVEVVARRKAAKSNPTKLIPPVNYNSGGLVPNVVTPISRNVPKKRIIPQSVIPPVPFVVQGTPPQVLGVIQKRRVKNNLSRIVIAPKSAPPGIAPATIRIQKKVRISRVSPQLLIRHPAAPPAPVSYTCPPAQKPLPITIPVPTAISMPKPSGIMIALITAQANPRPSIVALPIQTCVASH